MSGQFQALADFPAKGMSQPQWLVQASDSNIYGTTNRNQIFRYDLAASRLSLVYQLDPYGSQGKCPCQFIEGMDGKLYFVANVGGAIGTGAVFSLDIGLAKPAPAISGMYPASGPVGQKVLLWGKFLLGAKSVDFNGVPAASPVVTSVQSVQVTVPSGAITGPVTVTTGNGSFTTTQNFTVQ